MNLKQLGILIVAVVIIGGAALMLHKGQKSSWTGGGADVGKKLMGDDFAVNNIARVSVQHETNTLNLVKKGDLWRVRERGDYPANFSQLSDLLKKLRDLKVVQVEDIGPSQLARMELARGQGSNSAVVVEFEDPSDKPITTLLLGKKHLKKSPQPSPEGGDEGFPDGRYVEVGTNSQQVALVSDPLESLDANPDSWLNKDFFKVEKPKTIEVEFPVATNSWKLTRETEAGDWKLANTNAGEELDSAKISSVTSPFSSPTFNSVRPGAKLEGTNQPTVVKIETFDGFNYTINVGDKTNDDYLVTLSVTAKPVAGRVPGKDEKPDDKLKLDAEFKVAQQKAADKLKQEQSCQQWTYSVPGWSVDAVLKERSQLLADKRTEAPAGSSETNQMPPLVPLPQK